MLYHCATTITRHTIFQDRMLACPLGCPPERRRFSELKHLLAHLGHHHGCEPQDVRVDEEDEMFQKITIEKSEFL